MDILKPELVWVKDRCYRKLPIRGSSNDPEPEDLYPIEPYKPKPSEDDIDDADIVQHTGDKFWATISIPGALAFVINNPKVLRPMERNTRTKIKIPPKIQRDEHIEIIITGGDESSISEVYQRIDMMVDSARWKKQFTHFVTFPMNFDVLKKSFLEFREDVLENCKKTHGIEKNIFQDPNKLHLTIATLVLLDTCERESAVAVLQKSKEEIKDILRGQPLTVAVKGIEYMNDDPAEVNVLYAKVIDVNEDDSLQIISNKLLNNFEGSRLSQKKNDTVKLHITLMNTSFLLNDETSPRIPFDATEIMKNYKDYDFGVVTLTEIHISVRYTKAKDSYYMSTSVIKLPVK